MNDYCIHGFSFATSEERQAVATGHPLWEEYLAWDKRRHCGKPDMDDDHDREVFEAFIHGAFIEHDKGSAALAVAIQERDAAREAADTFAQEALHAKIANLERKLETAETALERIRQALS